MFIRTSFPCAVCDIVSGTRQETGNMNSTDPAADRAAARGRSVSQHRKRVAACLALFRSALRFAMIVGYSFS